MLTEDYILRMINQAVAALLVAIGLRKAGQYEQAHQTINQALEALTGLRAELLDRLEDQTVLKSITLNDQLDIDRARLLADLFFEQGNLYRQQNQDFLALISYQRALTLFLEISWSEDIQNDNEIKSKILATVAQLTGDLPFDLGFSLFTYYEKIEEYHQAEKTLQKLLENEPHFSELEQEQREFRQRLIQKTDQELSSGGFNQEEIAQLRYRGMMQ